MAACDCSHAGKRVHGCVYVGHCGCMFEKINNNQCVPVMSNRNAFVDLGNRVFSGQASTPGDLYL